MDAQVVAAIITATVTPVLAGVGAYVGTARTARTAQRNTTWETLRWADENLSDGDLDKAERAARHLGDLRDAGDLTREQRDFVTTALEVYLKNTS